MISTAINTARSDTLPLFPPLAVTPADSIPTAITPTASTPTTSTPTTSTPTTSTLTTSTLTTSTPEGPQGSPARRWRRGELCGRLTELSAWGPSASLTLAIDLVLEAQQQGEPVAWISTRESTFFPPDAAANGVDLGALPVVHANSGRTAGRAADRLLRSGAFALIIIDLGRAERGRAAGVGADLPLPLQSRLLQLALKHDAAVLFLTEKPSTAPSLGSLVSLRAQARRRKTGPGRYTCELLVLKDKRHGPGWQHDTFRNGPPGLR